MKTILKITVGIILAVFLLAAGCTALVGASLESSDSDSSDVKEVKSPKQKADEKAETPADDNDGVFRIEVTSTGSDSGSVTFVQPDNDSFNMSQANNVSLPFVKEWTGVDDLPLGWNMNAQQNGGGDLTCTVTLDGEVISENTSSGDYSVVTCSE